jgi:hypothetical protein
MDGELMGKQGRKGREGPERGRVWLGGRRGRGEERRGLERRSENEGEHAIHIPP